MKQTFDARMCMELAVEVMRQTVREPRADGKASPAVGAVIWKPDGSIETACRGELRHGDHAEYTLLERKNHDAKLDGAVIFATLEPCAPGSRNHPKLSCSERIVLARISEVWVGIEDPDPTVDRKGIKYLQDNGVVVHMFDRDLQELILSENAEFITQALDRASEADSPKATKNVSLSPLERQVGGTALDDLSVEALESFRTVAGIQDRVGSAGFNRRLILQGLMAEAGNQLIPTGFGLLLFGLEPRATMPQAGMLGTIHYEDGSEELRDFIGPQVLVPGDVLDWLREKLPNPIERSGSRRQSANAALYELVREAVVNALVHRDYTISGAKCHLIVTADTVVVKSPGKPVEPISVEQMQSFNAPMLSRNPILHYVFARMELAEERGLGLKSLKLRAESAGLPLPRFSWDPPYLSLTVFRSVSASVRALGAEILGRLTNDERLCLEFISQRESVKSAEMAAEFGWDERKVQRIMKSLIKIGLLRREGGGPSTHYVANGR